MKINKILYFLSNRVSYDVYRKTVACHSNSELFYALNNVSTARKIFSKLLRRLAFSQLKNEDPAESSVRFYLLFCLSILVAGGKAKGLNQLILVPDELKEAKNV